MIRFLSKIHRASGTRLKHQMLSGSIIFVALVVVACATAPQPSTAIPTLLTNADFTYTASQNDTTDNTVNIPIGHQATEGYMLGASDTETVYPDASCPANAPVRQYNILAINVEITLNRYLDYDPQGRMFVLEQDLARVRAEE